MPSFGSKIRPYVDAELLAAARSLDQGQAQQAFVHLQRAHVLGQTSLVQHVRVHWKMLLWGLQQRNAKEFCGQGLRLLGAAVLTGFGLVPNGNTGGANVSPFQPMPIAADLARQIEEARSSIGPARR